MSDSDGHAASQQELSVSDTEGQHHDLLIHGINRILDTEAAETTYAQIIDGLPLEEVANANSAGPLARQHPFSGVHRDLCSGVLEETRALRNNLALGDLKVEAKLLLDYKAASPHSRSFKMRLLELIAVCVHQIAVVLYERRSSRHAGHAYDDWAPPREDPDEPPELDDSWEWRQWPESGHPPSLFYHPWFVDYKDYPHGKADVVGYWAEARILGGVFLFDRRGEGGDRRGEGGDQEALYSHSNLGSRTYRIWKLHPWQKSTLYEWLTSPVGENDGASCPLPVMADDTNLERVDPEEPILETGIYRNPWERRTRRINERSDRRFQNRWDPKDWPSSEDLLESKKRAYARLTVQELEGEESEDGQSSGG